MPPTAPLRPAPEWDPRYTRMVFVSAAGHALVVAAIVLLAPYARSRPLPMVAYTVEITDANALGGRVPPGPITGNLGGGPTTPAPMPKGQPDGGASAGADKPPAPEPPAAKAEAPPATVPPAPKVDEPPPAPPEPRVEAKAEPKPAPPPAPKPDPKPDPKPEAKPEPKLAPKPEAKPEPRPEPKPVAKPEPKPEPKPVAKAEPKPEAKPDAAKSAGKSTEQAKPGAPPATAKPDAVKPATGAGGKAGSASGQDDAPARDAYAAAAERWKTRGGGGLGGNDAGSGPIGAGGDGKGGGGQLVGLEFIAYRQQVINTVKGRWTNVIARPGLVAKVRFAIAADGGVSDVRLEQSSGNPAYDGSVLRAVQQATLPAPPARYASEFKDFVIEFHSEETGGQGTG